MAESAFSSLVWGRPYAYPTFARMSDLRLIDLNLIYTIKEKILPVNGYVSSYTETVSPSSPILDPDTGEQVTPYQLTYKDLFYYNPDPSNPSLSGLSTVPTLSTTTGLFKIDYPNGVVYFSGFETAPITATYDYYTVYVQDGFPEQYEDLYDLEHMPSPMVSVDFVKRENTPFALGGKYSEDRIFVINVLANSDPQRDDLMDILETSLRYTYTQTIDYNNGFPILYNGTLNSGFDRGPANKWCPIRFSTVNSRVIRDPSLPDKLRHQGLLVLDIETN